MALGDQVNRSPSMPTALALLGPSLRAPDVKLGAPWHEINGGRSFCFLLQELRVEIHVAVPFLLSGSDSWHGFPFADHGVGLKVSRGQIYMFFSTNHWQLVSILYGLLPSFK